jgi:hypothetical protein
MEQHNIDSRFKEGLGNLNRKPSADAFARLQAKMAAAEETPVIPMEQPQEKKRPVWWLSIAAAVVLLLASVAVFRGLKETNPAAPELASVSQKATLPETNKTVKTEITTAAIAPEKTKIAIISGTKSKSAPALTLQPEKTGTAGKAKDKTAPVIAATKSKIPVNATVKETKTVLPETANPEPQLAYQMPEKTTATPETVSDLSGKPIEVIVKLDSKEKSAVAAVAANTPETATETKPSLLKNIFKQAKNLKNGDMSLAEMGLIQDTKLALESRNLHARFSKVFQN